MGKIIGLAVGVLALGGVWWLVSRPDTNPDAMMQKDESAMMKQDEGAMMKKEDAMKPSGEAMMAETMTIKLATQSNSGITGQATLVGKGEKTEVSILLSGAGAGHNFPSHLHQGACLTPGAIKYPLTNIVDSRSVTLLNVPLEEIEKQGPLALNVHQSATELKKYVACGDMSPAMTGDKMMQGEDAMMKKDEGAMMKKDEGAMMKKDERYVVHTKDALAAYPDKRRVLYFYANWCPSCKEADPDLAANQAQFPSDVVVIRVNYNDSDTDADEKALAKQYGITYQHTFVQIDAQGNAVTKWNGGKTAELLKNIK